MDPVIFNRLTRHRDWSADHYASWFADSVTRLIVDAGRPSRASPGASMVLDHQ